MDKTTPEDDEVLAQVRELLIAWRRTGSIGEIAVVRGYNQTQVEERPRIKLPAVKHRGMVVANN